MSALTDDQVKQIANRVMEMIGNPHAPAKVQESGSGNAKALGPGIFPDVNSAVTAAQKAFKELSQMPLSKREEIIAAIRRKMVEHTEELSRMANEETGLGRYEDKILKNQLVIHKTPGTEILQPAKAFSGDRGLMLLELAPYGVIGAITPVTNPTSTIICNTIGMVAAGNAVVFNTHPSAKKVSGYNVVLLNQAITGVGGPANLVTAVAEPTVESAGQLMKHPGIRLLVVTGGGAVVKAAMTSGKRAICAGPGNPPAVVDETADIAQAAKNIVMGASFDNGIICVLEKEVFVVASVADRLMDEMKKNNAVQLNRMQMEALEKVIFTEQHGPRQHAVVDKDCVGKNIQYILAKIGMNVDPKIRLAIAEVDENHPLVWTEQMMPVMPIVRVSDANRAIDLAVEAEHGYGHTATMHSKNLDNLSRMARVINCSIFVKNGPSVAGLSFGGEGYTSFSIASPTGEGLTTARSFSRERRCTIVDSFRIV